MKYEILSALDPNELEVMVNERLKAGWQLQGGVSVSPVSREEVAFTQAVVYQIPN